VRVENGVETITPLVDPVRSGPVCVRVVNGRFPQVKLRGKSPDGTYMKLLRRPETVPSISAPQEVIEPRPWPRASELVCKGDREAIADKSHDVEFVPVPVGAGGKRMASSVASVASLASVSSLASVASASGGTLEAEVAEMIVPVAAESKTPTGNASPASQSLPVWKPSLAGQAYPLEQLSVMPDDSGCASDPLPPPIAPFATSCSSGVSVATMSPVQCGTKPSVITSELEVALGPEVLSPAQPPPEAQPVVARLTAEALRAFSAPSTAPYDPLETLERGAHNAHAREVDEASDSIRSSADSEIATERPPAPARAQTARQVWEAEMLTLRLLKTGKFVPALVMDLV